MPELPDVEIARRRLEKWIGGATVVAARSNDRYILRPQSPATLRRLLVGRRVQQISRRGKWLRMELDNGGRLFSHLGMTGAWVRCDAAAPRLVAERARIDVLQDGKGRSSVRYVDSRRFGRLIPAGEDIAEWRELGPDPLADGIDGRGLQAILGRSGRTVKEVLMDQTALAGVGNILATEALWRARIDPRSRGRALSGGDSHRIARGLRDAIQKELVGLARSRSHGGSEEFFAYGRAGQPCRRCGSVLDRVVLGGRTTAFCPHCQRLLSSEAGERPPTRRSRP